MTVTDLNEVESITPGDELQTEVTLEDETVFSIVDGRRVTFPNLVPAAFGLDVGDSVGLRFVVRKPIYGKGGRIDTIFVDDVVETVELVEFRNGGTTTQTENRGQRTGSVSKQRVGRSRKRPQSRTNPNMMRDLVQGNL